MTLDPKKYIELSSRLDANCTYTDLCKAMGFELEDIYEGTSQISGKTPSVEKRQPSNSTRDENEDLGDAEW